MRKLNNKKVLGSWFTFPQDESLRLRIRPLDILSMSRPPTETNTEVSNVFEWFNYIMLDWEGFVDEDENPLECNEENKKLIFMYDEEVVNFSIKQATAIRGNVITKDAENLGKLQDGEQVKVVKQETVKAV